MIKDKYRPTKDILVKYADILVNFALGGGKGIKKGDVVRIIASEYAKPLYLELRKAVWKSGGHVISNYLPSNDEEYNVSRDFFDHAQNHQLDFFPHLHWKGLVEQIDHNLFISSETNLHALQEVDPKKILRSSKSFKPMHDWLREKENLGKFTWTIGLYATEALAKEAGLTLEDYWNQIIKACFLDKKDPVKVWRNLYKKLESYRRKLSSLGAEKFHVHGKDVDLWIKLGHKRRWMGGSGRNMPSFELFTSPDWRGTEGWIRFDQPLYRYGNLIAGIELEFKNGKVVQCKASKNKKVLEEMIAMINADKIGEFSLTDRRFSRITKFMAVTLYDENMGGPNGNTHIALGSAYHDCYDGDPSTVTKTGWQKLGFNDSVVHTDMISTSSRTVTAHFKDRKPKIIYKGGKFVL